MAVNWNRIKVVTIERQGHHIRVSLEVAKDILTQHPECRTVEAGSYLALLEG